MLHVLAKMKSIRSYFARKVGTDELERGNVNVKDSLSTVLEILVSIS